MNIKIYATLRDLLGTSLLCMEQPGPTVRAVLRDLAAAYPALGAKLWDEQENLTGQVSIWVNGRSMEYLSGLDTPVRPGDNLALFPPVGGG